MTGFFAEEDLTPNQIELARRRAAQGAGYIDLTSSNPTHQGMIFPPEILRGAADRYLSARRYDPDPRGAPGARAAIARYYAARTPPLALAPEDIVVTASTSEAYGLMFALLTEPGDNVLAPAVSYPLFEYLAAIYHVELRPYALDELRGWRVDPASLHAQADDRTRAVLVISPHNPTGAVIQTALPALGSLALPVICDEVFAAWGAPVPDDDQTTRAIDCALNIQRLNPSLNATLAAAGLPPVAYGIGVHCGPVVSAHVGTSDRRQYAVVGNTVNVGSRLCSQALAGEVVASNDVVQQLPEHLRAELGAEERVTVKGVAEPLAIRRATPVDTLSAGVADD